MNSTPYGNKNSVTESDSQAGGLPLLDYSVISARKLKQRFWAKEQSDKAGKTSRRVRRFYQRYFTGVGGRLRFLTLTSSDEAVAEGLDNGLSVEKPLKNSGKSMLQERLASLESRAHAVS